MTKEAFQKEGEAFRVRQGKLLDALEVPLNRVLQRQPLLRVAIEQVMQSEESTDGGGLPAVGWPDEENHSTLNAQGLLQVREHIWLEIELLDLDDAIPVLLRQVPHGDGHPSIVVSGGVTTVTRNKGAAHVEVVLLTPIGNPAGDWFS